MTGSKQKPAVRLHEMLTELMDNTIVPQQAQFRRVSELWQQMLPAELSGHCRVADISAGQLKVLVDSPSYMYELQLCSSNILAELQRRCPQARIRAIKLALC